MADVKISGLPASTTPLAGTEVLPIVQGGVTKQVSITNVTNGRSVAALSVITPTIQAEAGSAGGAIKNGSGVAQMQWGSGGASNLSLEVATNINPVNAAVNISPTGTGTVTINPATASTMNNVAIGGTTPLAGNFTTLGATGVATFSAGTVSAPAITTTGDTNTGIFFPAADTIAFAEGGAEAMRIDSSGQVGIGTSSPADKLNVVGDIRTTASGGNFYTLGADATGGYLYSNQSTAFLFYTGNAERMRIDSSGNVLVGTTSVLNAGKLSVDAGIANNGICVDIDYSEVGYTGILINRTVADGDLIVFQHAGNTEGSISVSGTTVSYNGGHLSRWSQLPNGSKDDTILKGTVLSNLDDMCVWEKDGVVADNEQLNKMKVSDVEGDTNVAGVFVNWTKDEQYGVDDMNVAMTGDMIIRIADGVVVQKGDLLMSAGDGTAKPQGDDIVRSKTIAKVTSNYVTCTYVDGSYCVPCVLMAC